MKVVTLFLILACLLDVAETVLVLYMSNIKINDLKSNTKGTLRLMSHMALNILAAATFLYWLT